jgi:hypothetical protein
LILPPNATDPLQHLYGTAITSDLTYCILREVLTCLLFSTLGTVDARFNTGTHAIRDVKGGENSACPSRIEKRQGISS